MKLRLWAGLGVLLSIASAARAIDLYDGSLGTLPSAQGWVVRLDQFGTPIETLNASSTTLDTTADMNTRSGYFNGLVFPVNPAFPTLDRAAGFVVSLDMRLIGEQHANKNRAGTSLIVLGSDRVGIEIGFWSNEIWVQSGSDFLHAEGAAFSTTAFTSYDVVIRGSTYQIKANGAALLSGNLRNYSGFGAPYTFPNFVFLGDNSGSAMGSMEFSRLSVEPYKPFGGNSIRPSLVDAMQFAIVPEPASIGLIAGAVLGLAANRRLCRASVAPASVALPPDHCH